MFVADVVFDVDYDGVNMRFECEEEQLNDVLPAMFVRALEPAVRWIGVDTDAVKKEAVEAVGKGSWDERIQRLATMKPSIKKRLEKIVDKQLMPFAENYFVWCALSDFFNKVEEPSKSGMHDAIVFISRCPGWLVVKKRMYKQGVGVEEMGGTMCSILSSIFTKMVDVSAKPGRKSIKALCKTLEKKPEDLRAFLSSLYAVGYQPNPDLMKLMKVYPHLKIPKPRGRLKKG